MDACEILKIIKAKKCLTFETRIAVAELGQYGRETSHTLIKRNHGLEIAFIFLKLLRHHLQIRNATQLLLLET
jgi:hypothetical protein